jgi:hypothetical protein
MDDGGSAPTGARSQTAEARGWGMRWGAPPSEANFHAPAPAAARLRIYLHYQSLVREANAVDAGIDRR